MDDLNLPIIPATKPKRLPAEAFDGWVNENLRGLREMGLLERIRRQPQRQPAARRFRLA